MPDALFIHGMLADRRVWRDVTPELAGTECRFLELPSHGAAPAWDGGDYQTQAFQMAQAICDEPVHLVGHSFGATVALRLAVERPDLLASLTLIEPVFFYAARQVFPAEFNEYCDRAKPVIDAIQQGDILGAAERFLGAWGVEGTWVAMPPPMRAAIAEKMPLIEATAPSLFEDSGNIWPRLGRIECPVMLATGLLSEEVMARVQAALELNMAVQSSLRFDGAGHMIPVTHGKRLGREIAAFTS